jgi:hypothetical protein
MRREPMELLRSPIVKRGAAILATKEIIDRIREARQPKRSFVRRNIGKLALVAGGTIAFVAWRRLNAPQAVYGSTPPGRGEPSIEPGERLSAPLRAPEEATETAKRPVPTGSS